MSLSDTLLILAALLLLLFATLHVWSQPRRATWVCTLCAEEFGDRVFAEWHLHVAHHN